MLENVFGLVAKVLDGAPANSLEGQAVEFKTDGRSANDDLENLADAAACFANADGGVIIVGIDDRLEGEAALLGTNLLPDPTRTRIWEVCDPHLVVECELLPMHGKQLMVIEVKRGVAVHSVKKRMPTERIGSSCQPMSAERIASVTAERRGEDWSALPSGVSALKADAVALATARRLLERNPKDSMRRIARASDLDMLRAIGVVTDQGDLTNAGSLLFSEGLGRGEEIAFIHKKTPAGALLVNEQLRAPLLTAVMRTFDLIESRLDSTAVGIGKGQQVHISDLPESAVREAVANAVMHREYRQSGRITVEHTQTQLSVTSPGSFVSGVHPDNLLTTSSRTRNTQLAQALRVLNLAEAAGTGVDKMYAEMVRVGHQPPIFTADGETVRVALAGGAPNSAITRFVATLPPHEAEDADTMLVLLHLLTHRTINAETAMILFQKSSIEEAQGVLDRLESDQVELIEPTRETARSAHPRYRLREGALSGLGAAVTYRRRTTDQLDRKVIELLREAGAVNARMIKLMLDLDPRSTSRLIADLVDRGILQKQAGAQRGPGVMYGRGPQFPVSRVSPPREQKVASVKDPNQLEFDLEV